MGNFTPASIHCSMIFPVGASLAMGKLTVRIYKGEDFPQLDSPSTKLLGRSGSNSELVDPYCVVSYAGHKNETPVRENSYDPEWNHEASLPFQVALCLATQCKHVHTNISIPL